MDNQILKNNSQVYLHHVELILTICRAVMKKENAAKQMVEDIYEQAYRDNFQEGYFLAKKHLLAITIERLLLQEAIEALSLATNSRKANNQSQQEIWELRSTALEKVIFVLQSRKGYSMPYIASLLELSNDYVSKQELVKEV